MHKAAAFTKNPKTLLTERSGKAGTHPEDYTPTANSWLLNPLIAHALLTPSKAALYFEALPSDSHMINIGHQPCKFKDISKAITSMVTENVIQVQLSDIQRLQTLNFLYFSAALQNRVMASLEDRHNVLTNALYTFAHNKFEWERQVHSTSLRAATIAHLLVPAVPLPDQPALPLTTISSIGAAIKEMHRLRPFTKRKPTLLTELPSTQQDASIDNAWFLNPVIAHAVINSDKFYPPIPTYQDLESRGYPPFDYTEIQFDIQEMLEHEKLVTMTAADIQYTDPGGHITFSSTFRNSLLLALVQHRPEDMHALTTFVDYRRNSADNKRRQPPSEKHTLSQDNTPLFPAIRPPTEREPFHHTGQAHAQRHLSLATLNHFSNPACRTFIEV